MGILKEIALSGEEAIRRLDRKNKNFFFEGELKERMLAEVDEKLLEIEQKKEKIQKEKATKAAEKAVEKALLEEEEKRQRNAATEGEAMFGDILEKRQSKEEIKNDSENYQIIEVSTLVDSTFKSFQNIPTGMALCNRNLKATPIYVKDGKDILCVEKIYEIESNNPNIAMVVLETKNSKFEIDFKVTRSF